MFVCYFSYVVVLYFWIHNFLVSSCPACVLQSSIPIVGFCEYVLGLDEGEPSDL